MNIGNQISAIRKEHQLTQEKFGELFHVIRQTVSNWENEKSYPDLNILIAISNRFGISLDQLLKEDGKMVQAIDRERIIGKIKREKSLVDFLTGAGGAWLCLVYFLRILRSEPSSFVPGFSCWESDFSKRRAMINRCLPIWNSTERSRHDEKIFTQDCMCPLARGNRLFSFCFVSPGDVFSVEQHHHLYFVCRLFAGYGRFFHCSFSAKIVRFSIFC